MERKPGQDGQWSLRNSLITTADYVLKCKQPQWNGGCVLGRTSVSKAIKTPIIAGQYDTQKVPRFFYISQEF